uniref:Retrovirus-related Pol polyprotein from transposon TNT 1-94 n=1 Tax=Cajanus cajan TaxID=3821 RepID=A0A151RKM1_CAJCA|nr:Retrovirus-related Pol polyprotein from transposon TNT 1-94 [Cajanus cajan]
MVLIDASTRWSHVCLLSTRNQAFARLLAQLIRLRAHFPDYPIKKIRLDNAGEFTSHAFNVYCISIGIDIDHPIAHVHTQNGLAESFIKRLKLIARPLLMRSKLPMSTWGHAILHAAILIRIRPTSYHKFSPLQLVFGEQPNISHLRIFGCAVYVPIAPPQRTKMGPQRRLGIYVGYESPSIIKYLEPLTGDLFTARFADCHFNELIFPTLGGEQKQLEKDIINTTNESQIRLKRGRPIGSKDKNPRIKKGAKEQNDQIEDVKTQKDSSDITHIPVPEETQVPEIIENEEISINYVMNGIRWNRNNVNIDDVFAYNIALNEINDIEDQEPKSINDCRQRNDWPKWKDAIEAELDSLAKRKVFGPVLRTPKGVKPIGYKWVFVRKQNENGEIVRYKARLVAQGFSERPGIDFGETYSPVVDANTF